MMSYRMDISLLPQEVVAAATVLLAKLMEHTDYDGVQVTFTGLQGDSFIAPSFDVQIEGE